MKISLIKTTLATVALMGAIGIASAQNLLTNGSFETNPPSFPANGFVNSASIVPDGWTGITAGGLAAPYIIKSGSSTFSTIAQDGNVFIGLQNNTANAPAKYGTWIYQNLSGLTVGENYTVSFYLRARNASSQTGTLQVQLGTGGLADNQSILSVTAKTGATVNSWELVTCSFTATATNPRLNFVFLSNTGDQMVFIDNVSLVKTSTIPESSTYVLLAGMCMFSAVLSQRLIRRR
ncbi:DUF642 domain-containing protein [Opitutaceae bacterium TAV4]|nr:DUF642 domain-containing protein [Opitutaceae bacterium TAV4]RRJ99630.1 DUF642 domain-containing protein [Opitutaceae bacterium TAV3]